MEVRQIRFCFCRGNARETAWAVSERVAWGHLWKVGFVGSRENVRETARVMSGRKRRGGGGVRQIRFFCFEKDFAANKE